MHKTTILCQFGLVICHQLPNHISINSQPFLVGIVSMQIYANSHICYSQVPLNGTRLSWPTPTLPQLGTPPGLQIPPNVMNMTPGLMNLAFVRGEFTTISLIPLADPAWLTTTMLSNLNPLILKSSGPILAGSTNTPLRKVSRKPLNGLLPPLGIL